MRSETIARNYAEALFDLGERSGNTARYADLMDAVAAATSDLQRLLRDPEPGPAIVAAEALGRFGPGALRNQAIEVLLENSNASRHEEYVAIFALYSLNQIPDLPDSVKEAVKALPAEPVVTAGSQKQRENYLPRLITAIAEGVR